MRNPIVRVLIVIGAVCVGALVSYPLAMLVAGARFWSAQVVTSKPAWLASLTGVLPVAGGLGMLFFARRRLFPHRPIGSGDKASGAFRALQALVFALYGVTWAVGAPYVQSRPVDPLVLGVEHLTAAGRPLSSEPTTPQSIFLSIPIVPSVVLVYREHEFSQLTSWGGWEVHAWYGVGSRRLAAIPLWRS